MTPSMPGSTGRAPARAAVRRPAVNELAYRRKDVLASGLHHVLRELRRRSRPRPPLVKPTAARLPAGQGDTQPERSRAKATFDGDPR